MSAPEVFEFEVPNAVGCGVFRYRVIKFANEGDGVYYQLERQDTDALGAPRWMPVREEEMPVSRLVFEAASFSLKAGGRS